MTNYSEITAMIKVLNPRGLASDRRSLLLLIVIVAILTFHFTWILQEEFPHHRLSRFGPTTAETSTNKDGGEDMEDHGPEDGETEFDGPEDPTFKFALAGLQKLAGEIQRGKDWKTLIEEAFPISAHTTPNNGTLDVEYIHSLRQDLLMTYEKIRAKPSIRRMTRSRTGTRINVAVISCGYEGDIAINMLKSVVIFSQDSVLHVIAFSDADNILYFAQQLLELQWQVISAGLDFTFEMHLEWFPTEDDEVDWMSMYKECATQRLFFPQLLPHIDSLIYLDTDVIVLSNLTEFYVHFRTMNNTKLAAAALNNEPTLHGWYGGGSSKVPYYGTTGINAGVMLMNLTLMREFNMVERAIAANTIYADKIALADQDIYNIIFHSYPELLHELPCTYNFYWIHCGMPNTYNCYNERGEHVCWCKSLEETGLHILHGNSRSFFFNENLAFLSSIYDSFAQFDVQKDSPVRLLENLEEDFLPESQNSCHKLTADMLYKNAKAYLRNVYEE